MSTAPRDSWSVQDYLDFERSSANHNLIVGNIYASLHTQLRQRPCVVFPSDMRLKISTTGLYTYPDISVVCDPPRFDDDHRDTLLNPTVIIEVLSPSTENYDRGKKFHHYRTLDSLQEYILASQDSTRLEHYLRQPNHQWLFSDVTQLDAPLELPSIGCTLLLSDAYEKVNFENSES